jgi:putative spermidine/putrescine transport system permease protein
MSVSAEAGAVSVKPAQPQRRFSGIGFLAFPVAIFLLIVFAYPLILLISRSVTEASPEWYSIYEATITDVTVLRVLWRTVVMSFTVTLVCILLGYPYAYLMTRVSPMWRAVLVALVLLPFWTSLMARTFAWYVLLQDNGVINTMFGFVGLGPFELIRTTTGVTIGMAQLLLPFMVLPLYATLSGIDQRLMNAAISLGAPPRRAWLKIYLPLSMPGVVAGVTLVFILALGFYITPKILGSPKESMIAQLIDLQVSRLTDFGSAGGLSLLLLIVTAILLLLMSRVVSPSKALGVRGAEE